jgi:hypothetical protein
MASNFNGILEKLKDNAVGRCRERIELAADRAKGALNGKKPENPTDSPPKREPPGMTSYMKRQHGL